MTTDPLRVLVIDNDQAEYLLIAHLLGKVRRARYSLTWSAELAPEWQAILDGEYDVVLLDYHSQQHALGMLSALPGSDNPSPIVLMTRELDDSVDFEAARLGAADYVAKGQLDVPLLERIIRYVVKGTQTERKLARLAHYDSLTGIANRALFNDRLRGALDRSQRHRQNLGLMFLDLDGFKTVNDSLGHDAGDQLVAAIAHRLGTCIRRSDSLARMGGDEFAIILEELASPADILHVVRKILDAVTRPVTLSGHVVSISCSIGIALYPEGGHDQETLLKHAEMAMYRAKANRGASYCFYEPEMDQAARTALHLESDMRRGLRRGEFALFYQPRICLSTGQIVGVEGLIRWLHPTRGLIEPKDFIPLAETTGLIVPLGYWVIQQACRDVKALGELGLPPLEVAVNLSFQQFQDAMFVETVARILSQAEIDPTLLEFELTETTIMAQEDTAERMRAISRMGPRFALDDFGTGYSSLSHLQRLPIDIVKIDRSFVQHALTVSDDATIIRALINLAHELKKTVIAEGVEQREQVDFLRQHGCHQVQGFFYCRAVPFASLQRLLQAQHAASLPAGVSLLRA